MSDPSRSYEFRHDVTVATTIYELLEDLRASSIDQRDKGDKFERLVKAYVTTDPAWAQKFSDVWSWTEWPGRGTSTDTGIDLVARNRDDDGLTAIQCKFYAAGASVAKSEIDSFISRSAGAQWTRRYVFDTAAKWSGNAEETLKGVAQRIDVGDLDQAGIDWSQFSWSTPHVVVPSGKKALRPHQQRALVDVVAGLTKHERGTLVMACGTGKTFTSLKIAEEMVGEGGSVLFLVPSIQLLSQTLREWMANAQVDVRPFAVCSDVRVGRKATEDDADMSTIDLTEPATTDAVTLMKRIRGGKHAQPRMTVVFSTYQSIDVVINAQKREGLAPFDLVICDEAHRTSGVTLSGAEGSTFVKVHDANLLKSYRRLYMTATPRVFGDDARRKANDADAVLADMGDEEVFGPVLHRLGFGDAVEAGLLTDYKVLVLAVDETYVAENFQQVMAEAGELKLDDTAKLLGCWNGLAKNFGPIASLAGTGSRANGAEDDTEQDVRVGRSPMRTAVAFAQNIASSKAASFAFPQVIDRALEHLPEDVAALRVEAVHVDGTMGIHERNTHLAWLKAAAGDDVCRILTNARCLSEGVDVPTLDAVIFLTPRGSQVDVVQSVGRVMRKAPGKELGYIILPVVVPTGTTPEAALNDNERFKVVWQVLQALRSHDERFQALVNQIQFNKKKPSKIEIIPVTNPGNDDQDGSGETGQQDGAEKAKQELEQTMLRFPVEQFREAMYAKIVLKVGERRYWETWARDVADIAATHITRIQGLLADPNGMAAKAFTDFLNGLRGNLNDSITTEQAIEMLAQHLVTRPIFEALFEDYDFTQSNPVAITMEKMLTILDEHKLPSENQALESFYGSVRRRVAGVDNAEGKQRILIELYDKFFAAAFKKTVDKLGIVYTPVEIVDFILRSADDVLRSELGQGLTDEGVHVLDGFTGTGTFMVRLLASGLIKPEDLPRKYAKELHANEMLLLAYYIAAVNIETTYQDLTGSPEPFPGLILTDTFQSWEDDDRSDLDVFPENNERLERLKALPITVIVGNPPYSSGQDSANDDNANESYPGLDGQIRDTYAKQSTATNKNSLYDSYIRAIKWATLRIQDRGVIAYVSNGGWLDSNTADGMRLVLASEFSSIHVYNLRGNQRTTGELARREGGKVFGGGSRATVAITVLVKNPEHSGPATVHYSEVADYLSREQKLAKIAEDVSITALESVAHIEPNKHGDWLNHRREDFGAFLAVGDKDEIGIFAKYAAGVKTKRDLWVWDFGNESLMKKVNQTATAYNVSLNDGADSITSSNISWSRKLSSRANRGQAITVARSAAVLGCYRPFSRMWLYSDSALVDEPGSTPSFFPGNGAGMGFVVTAPRAEVTFATLMIDRLPDLSFYTYSAQFFARWRFEKVTNDPEMLSIEDMTTGEVIDGYRKVDNITDEALVGFQAAYFGEQISKDDIFFYTYGLLHSAQYRTIYAADLKKMLPRIPFLKSYADFRAFCDAGRTLSDLHLNYENVDPYPLSGLDLLASDDDYAFFAVNKKMTFGGKGKDKNRGVIHYNDRITISGIPEEAYQYTLGSRSAIEWIIDRYWVKTDEASGVVNNPNEWSREVGNPRYILDLLASVIAVSMETMTIVNNLPALDVRLGSL